MPCRVGFVNMLPESSTSVSALLPTALLAEKARQGNQSKNSLQNLLYQAFCHFVVLAQQDGGKGESISLWKKFHLVSVGLVSPSSV